MELFLREFIAKSKVNVIIFRRGSKPQPKMKVMEIYMQNQIQSEFFIMDCWNFEKQLLHNAIVSNCLVLVTHKKIKYFVLQARKSNDDNANFVIVILKQQ